MPVTTKKHAEFMQDIVRSYRDDLQPWPATAKQIAAWAVHKGEWNPPRGTAITLCAREISRAMREETYRDPQGRIVRIKHAARVTCGEEQLTLWDDIRTADRGHMTIAFQQRRNQIVGECRQLKSDVDSFNENANTGELIQLVLDFTYDIEELESNVYKRPKQPR